MTYHILSIWLFLFGLLGLLHCCVYRDSRWFGWLMLIVSAVTLWVVSDEVMG